MHIYFSGIGGVGIGPLAQLALDAGYEVSGSDLHESEMTKSLVAQGVNIAIGQDGSEIKESHETKTIDWFVYSSSLPEDHPEIRFAKERGIKLSKRAEFLNLILREKNLKLIAVAGTHGKTSTTGMLVWLFKQLGLPVSYSVGSTLSFGPSAQYQKGSEYFVYECDEFDRNFLEFQPTLSLITSLDYDHPDTYPTETEYFEAFGQFASQSKLCLTWESLADEFESDSELFVVPDSHDFSALKLPGEHMRRNAWLAMTAINRLGLVNNDTTDWEMLIEKINSFPGTARRFEKLEENLYTDYAHHPSEIAATIQMALELNPNVVIVYQPHQNIRQHELLESNSYQDCFEGAKKVYWLPTYLSREYKDLPVLEPEELIKTIPNGEVVETAELNDELWRSIQAHQSSGDLVLCRP